MAELQGQEKSDGTLVIQKSNEKLTEENSELAQNLDYITKEEMIEAIKLLANEIGVSVSFTYDNKKNQI